MDLSKINIKRMVLETSISEIEIRAAFVDNNWQARIDAANTVDELAKIREEAPEESAPRRWTEEKIDRLMLEVVHGTNKPEDLWAIYHTASAESEAGNEVILKLIDIIDDDLDELWKVYNEVPFNSTPEKLVIRKMATFFTRT
jgi:hypothetical protein